MFKVDNFRFYIVALTVSALACAAWSSSVVAVEKLSVNNEVSLDVWSDVEYDLDSGVISFGITGPFFCFDFSDKSDFSVFLDVIDFSGQRVLSTVGLESSLRYDYNVTPRELKYTTAKGTRCFVEDEAGFRLMDGRTLGVPGLFRDAFEARRDLTVTYSSEQEAIRPGDFFEYQVVIENIGNVDIELAGFQELYPDNSDEFDAWFRQRIISCEAIPVENADCGTILYHSTLDSIRVEDMRLGQGSKVILDVVRELDPDSKPGSTVKFMAGVVPAFGREWDAKNNVGTFEIDVVE